MKMPANLICAGAAVLLCAFHGSDAVADQFSFHCPAPGFEFYLTFDDLKKRVIGYNYLNGRIPSMTYYGPIAAISPDEIQFDLVVYGNSNLKIGNFRLNRKQGWMTSSRSHYQDKQPCEPTPTRSVMDLWQLIDAD